MNRSIVILILIFLAKSTFSQQQAFINIFEEHTYPAEAYAIIAQKQDTWTFNGKTIKYKTGKYDIKINSTNQFDTIKFQNIQERAELNPENGQAKKYDTTTATILCKFRENHNYKLGQLLPNHFEIYSLDTFETRTSIVFKVINNKRRDTLYLYNSYPQLKVFSDTTITLINSNEKVSQSFRQHIELSKTDRAIWFDESKPAVPKDDIFEFYYNFLHAENLEIEFDVITNKYKLRLVK